jgi:hypothetical protein
MAAVGANTAAAQARAMKGSWVELKSPSPFVSMSMQYTEPKGKESRYASQRALVSAAAAVAHRRARAAAPRDAPRGAAPPFATSRRKRKTKRKTKKKTKRKRSRCHDHHRLQHPFYHRRTRNNAPHLVGHCFHDETQSHATCTRTFEKCVPASHECPVSIVCISRQRLPPLASLLFDTVPTDQTCRARPMHPFHCLSQHHSPRSPRSPRSIHLHRRHLFCNGVSTMR